MTDSNPAPVEVPADKEFVLSARGLTSLMLAAFALWVVWLLWAGPTLVNWIGPEKLPQLGQLGDLFGGVNALFTALAFGALIWTAIMQRRELTLQRIELSESRAVMSRQATDINEQTKLSKLQALDFRVFESLRFLQSLSAAYVRVPRTEQAPGESDYQEIQLFASLANHMRKMAREIAGLEVVNRTLTDEEFNAVKSEYIRIFDDHERHIGPFMRNLYFLFNTVDAAQLSQQEADAVHRLIGATLSRDAAFLAAIHAAAPFEHKQTYLIFGLANEMLRELDKEQAWIVYAKMPQTAFWRD